MFVLFGYISRMARTGTVDSLRSNYTRTAILKGLPRRTVIWTHVLRNSLLPTITVISVQTGYLVGGLVVTETLFNYKGLGLLFYTALQNVDYNVLLAYTLIGAMLTIIGNLVADIALTVADPRIRLA